jgi:hypothetical protein
MLSTASSLRRPLVERQYFDPTNPKHLESLDTFLKTGNWGEVQFYAELPFVEVPVTVLTKFAMYERGVSAETAQERAARLATKSLVEPRAPESNAARRKRLAAANVRVVQDLAAMKAADIRRASRDTDEAEEPETETA